MRRRRWAWWALIAVVLAGAVGLGLALPPYRRARNLEGCTKNLKDLGTALEMYSTDHRGKFPCGSGFDYGGTASDFSRLVGRYVDHIPTCPAAGRDTYTESYVATCNPDAYTVFCSGTSHPGLAANFPMLSLYRDLCLESPDRVWPLGGRLPVGVEVEGLAPGMTLEQVRGRVGEVERTRLGNVETGTCHADTGSLSVECRDGILTYVSGKAVTCPNGSFQEGDAASRVREVLGLPSGYTRNGFEATSLIYADEATSTTLTVPLRNGKVSWRTSFHRPRSAYHGGPRRNAR